MSSHNNGVAGLHNSYIRIIAALKVFFRTTHGSASFVWYDTGTEIFEYFAKQ